MRIIDQIDHPFLKISVFKSDERISVKFENEGYEQTFKLGADERFRHPENVRKWVDDHLLESVLSGIQAMHRAKLASEMRHFPPEEAPMFEEII